MQIFENTLNILILLIKKKEKKKQDASKTPDMFPEISLLTETVVSFF